MIQESQKSVRIFERLWYGYDLNDIEAGEVWGSGLFLDPFLLNFHSLIRLSKSLMQLVEND